MSESDAVESEADTVSFAIPDRADAPISEITERFFKAIVAKVPVERIEELHLFAPLRQGGVETGIAVIAARVLPPVPVAPPVEEPAPLALELDEEAPAEARVEDAVLEPMESSDEVVEFVEIESEIESAAADEDSPYAPEVLHDIAVDAIEESIPYVAEAPAEVERHTVYTARYRLVQKGPERGKWEATVVDEADAPLVTVEMVVRGVQRRAGEASDTTRYTGAQIAHALRHG
ncbi:MAG TPA: hypothetical protein VE869_16145 [Gemmatimonas sp.]|nr:hypothetical protein [Gemmatimonas sp.]